MKGLSLTLPYPYLIAAAATRPDLGKCWETRDWAPVTWRGELAIHAARNLAPVGGRDGLLALCAEPPFDAALAVLGLDGPALLAPTYRGCIVAVATFRGAGTAAGGWVNWSDQDGMPVPEPELRFGDYRPGRRVWRLDAIQALPAPVPCRGGMGLWDVPADVQAHIAEALR